MERRVVITGMGIWSCLGQNLKEVKESLHAGRSGIGLERERLEYGYRSGLTGIVPRPQLKGILDRRLRRLKKSDGKFRLSFIFKMRRSRTAS